MTLSEFVGKYPSVNPRRRHANQDEIRQLDASDGVMILDSPPAKGVQGSPDDAQSRHLWVFRAVNPDVPYILEVAPNVRPGLASGVAKHSNLTGGGVAHCGGEMWIDITDAHRLFVNGSSGRYGPQSEQQLEDAVGVFRDFGYDVISYGWNDETHKPHSLYYQ